MLKQTFALSAILGARFFGIFLVMPILAVYTLQLDGITPTTMALAMGGYALTQVIFQIPFGIWSDKIDRRKIIFVGLVIFGIGSIVCAFASNVEMLILGRFLQGAGAIGGVVSAMIADLVSEEQRSHAMAIMGGVISMSFTLAMILGPLLGAHYGVPFLFWLTAILSVFAIFVLIFFVPKAPKVQYSFNQTLNYESLWKNKNLQIMNITNFLQKSFMTLAFIIIPVGLTQGFELQKTQLVWIYLPAAILGVLSMAPAAILGEKKGKFKTVLVCGILLLGVSYLCMLSANYWVFIIGVFIFFIGFSLHEPIMQSLASRYCKTYQKGAAMGIFTSCGYLGSFLGALMGSHIYELFGMDAITLNVIVICIAWAILLKFLNSPAYFKNLYIDAHLIDNKQTLEQLYTLNGVKEWFINLNENKIVIKYNTKLITQEQLLQFLKTLYKTN